MRLVLMAVVAVAVLALAGIVGYRISKSRPPLRDGETPPPHRVAGEVAMESLPLQEGKPSLCEFKKHVDGWSYAVESESDQSVSFDGRPSLLKVTNNGNRRIVFRKEIAIRDGDLKVHRRFKVLPKGTGTTRYELLYFDDKGLVVSGENKYVKSSSSDASPRLPKGAVRAQLSVEYAFPGTASIELPYFTAVSKLDHGE